MRKGPAACARAIVRLRTALRLAALSAALLLPCVSAAEDVPPDEVEVAPPADAELAPIVIDADRVETAPLVERSFETPDDISGFGETIFAEPTWRSFETPAELLSQSVGAQIRRQGGRDDFSTLTIRGAPAAQVRILLDGVALGRASDSVVNLADLPVDTIDRIEIYRGFSPVSLTPVSAAGVVNVITRDPHDATGSVAVGGGSFGTAKVNASGAGPVAGGSAAAFASYRHTDGDFEYIDDFGTINYEPDDSHQKRKNNDSDAVENLLRWRRNVTDSTRLQLRNHVFYKEEGVPGIARFPAKARLETVREIAAAALSGTNGRWSVEQIATWESKDLTDFGSSGRDNSESETTASTTAGRWARPFGKSHWLSGSGEFTWEGFDQHEPAQQAERSSLAIAAGDDWTIRAIDTTVSLQLRHQEIWNESDSTLVGDDSDRSTDPRLGIRWQPFSGLAIKSNVSTYFRPPNFDELYGTDGFTTGNPALEPESGLAWDAGFEWTAARDPFGEISLGYSYFGSDIDDIILVELNFNRSTVARNVTKATIRGHEARVEWKGPFGTALSANYTYQEAVDDSGRPFVDGDDLAGIAPHEGWVRASWTRGLVVLAYDVAVTGAHYADSEEVYRIPTRTEHNVTIVFGPFWHGFRVTLEGDNLGDTLVPDPIGYPLPGRSFFATLSWQAERNEEDGDAG